jgi:hypothetical protein
MCDTIRALNGLPTPNSALDQTAKWSSDMTYRFLTAVLCVSATLVSGCATKNYGTISRTGIVPTMTCAQLSDELDQIEAFRASVQDKSKFTVGSAAGLFLDWGRSNAKKKDKALSQADTREASVRAAMGVRGCA